MGVGAKCQCLSTPWAVDAERLDWLNSDFTVRGDGRGAVLDDFFFGGSSHASAHSHHSREREREGEREAERERVHMT